jgi:AmmeMemoRadiSam system protein B/AmmeMemoRadiSam system protein A
MSTTIHSMQASVAGTFYPADRKELIDLLQNLFQTARTEQELKSKTKIAAVVAPHAGYVYSGLTAAHAYKMFNPARYKKVVVIGPAHHKYCEGVVTHSQSFYETPLGISPKDNIDPNLGITINDDAFIGEHSVEAHLPFLQYRLLEEGMHMHNYPITLLLYGNILPGKLAKKLDNLLDEDTFLIISSDLSHYHDLQTALSKDEEAIEAILSGNCESVMQVEACGKIGISGFLQTKFSRSYQPEFIHYSNSEAVSKDSSRVVGYCSIGFEQAFEKQSISEIVEFYARPDHSFFLSTEFQKDIVHFLRYCLESYLHDKTIPDIADIAKKYPQLTEEIPCFVTLNKANNLRGCIGSIQPVRSLHQDLVINCIKAACEDPRFKPMEENELADIQIEVSILGSPKFLKVRSEFELLNALEPHKHGVIIQQKNKRATFLPQVWDKVHNKIDFLNQLCRKAGLKPEAWRIPKERVQVFVYEVISFAEQTTKE